jgi:hypothetical protein
VKITGRPDRLLGARIHWLRFRARSRCRLAQILSTAAWSSAATWRGAWTAARRPRRTGRRSGRSCSHRRPRASGEVPVDAASGRPGRRWLDPALPGALYARAGVAMPASHAQVRLLPGALMHHRSRPPREVAIITNLLNSQVPEPLFHNAGAERASSASNHPFRNSPPMLGAEFFGRSHNGTCCRIEPFTESPVISRGVIGTLGESSGKRHWRNSNHASIRPELVRILHFLFPLP